MPFFESLFLLLRRKIGDADALELPSGIFPRPRCGRLQLLSESAAAVKRKPDGPTMTTPVGEVRGAEEAYWAHNLTESSVDVWRYTRGLCRDGIGW